MSKRFLPRLAALALAALVVAPAPAQESAIRSFPNRPVRFVVGFVAGSGTDIITRLVTAKLSEALGQPVIVENKAGAQSIIAADFVAKSAPDGYTLLTGPVGPMAMAPAIYPKLQYNTLRDFAPVTMIGSQPMILAVDPALPIRTVKELLDYAKARPNDVNYAASAAPFQLAAELLKQKTGTRFAYIPYKGSNESVNALMTGQVTMTLLDLPSAMGPAKGGRIRALAIMSTARHPAWPDVPTISEAGLKDLEVGLWTGIFAPVATPAAIVKRLNEEIARVVRLPETRERLAAIGIQPAGNTPEEFGRIVAADIAKWTAVAKEANIKAD